MRRWIREIFCALCLGILVSTSRGAEATVSEPSFPDLIESWQIEQGLPQNAVSRLFQTQDGYLWVGTYNGLGRFDGIRFVVFDANNTRELASSRITSLWQDPSGTLWVGQETGDLAQFTSGRWTRMKLPQAWPGGGIEQIAQDAEGGVWMVHRNGFLLRWNDGKAIPHPVPGGADSITTLIRTTDGPLYALRDHQLFCLERGELQPWKPAELPASASVIAACAGRNGGVWVVFQDRVQLWQGDHCAADLGTPPWGDDFVTAMAEMANGYLAVGTLQHGLFALSPSQAPQQVSRNHGLLHDWVRALLEDREGNLWVATGAGLQVCRPRRVTMQNAPDQWQSHSVLSIAPGVGGEYWVGTEGVGLYHYRNGEFTRYGREHGLTNAFVWSVQSAGDATAWVGTWGGGLFAIRDKQIEVAPGWDRRANVVLALYRSPGGSMWAGTNRGLAEWSDQKWKWHEAGLGESEIRTIYEDRTGAIWFGLSGTGVGRISQGVRQTFGRQDGLPADTVWCLREDENGTLWMGTFGGGLCRFKDGHFRSVGMANGLPNNVICHIADDGQGHFWCSTYGGIFRVRQSELNRCADGAIERVACLTLGKTDGLASLECTGGFQPSGFRTDDGRLWFPTTKGLAVIDPTNLTIRSTPPPVIIEEAVVDERSRGVTEPLTIAPGRHRVEIRYTALNFRAPDRVRFRHRLTGLDAQWIESGTRRIVDYSYLPPGKYTLEVSARLGDGAWNPTAAQLAVTVQPYFWQTWWFRIAATVACLALVIASVRFIVARRARLRLEASERQRALERERARIAQDIHDDLGASLTRISLLSQSVRVDFANHEAASDLDQICTTARNLTRAMDEIVWAVNPRHDSLDSLVTYLGRFAPQFLESGNVRCRIEFPLQLPPAPLSAEVRHNLFLAVKEALHNLVKHAGATEATLSLVPGEKSFILTVQDNGHGFSTNGTQPTDIRAGGGNGLPNMQQRLTEIGGQCRIESGPGSGTTITFEVPWKP